MTIRYNGWHDEEEALCRCGHPMEPSHRPSGCFDCYSFGTVCRTFEVRSPDLDRPKPLGDAEPFVPPAGEEPAPRQVRDWWNTPGDQDDLGPRPDNDG